MHLSTPLKKLLKDFVDGDSPVIANVDRAIRDLEKSIEDIRVEQSRVSASLRVKKAAIQSDDNLIEDMEQDKVAREADFAKDMEVTKRKISDAKKARDSKAASYRSEQENFFRLSESSDTKHDDVTEVKRCRETALDMEKRPVAERPLRHYDLEAVEDLRMIWELPSTPEPLITASDFKYKKPFISMVSALKWLGADVWGNKNSDLKDLKRTVITYLYDFSDIDFETAYDDALAEAGTSRRPTPRPSTLAAETILAACTPKQRRDLARLLKAASDDEEADAEGDEKN